MNYHNITYPDMNNGEGLRVVLWLSGCSHKCLGCQNSQTWDANSGIQFDESAKEELFKELDKEYISGLTLTGGDPLFENNLECVLDLVTEMNKRYNEVQYIDREEYINHNILIENVNETRLSTPQKSIWIYTGYTWNQIMNYHSVITDDFDYIEESYTDCLFEKRKNIVSQCDVLVDGRYIESKRDVTLKWRGSSNQNVIDIQKSLQQKKVILWCD